MARQKDDETPLDLIARILAKKDTDKEFIAAQKQLPRLDINDFELKKHPEYDWVEIFDPKTSQKAGSFQWVPARIQDVGNILKQNIDPDDPHTFELPGHVMMDYPELEDQYKARGLGEQMYKKIEELTGKKVMPDTSLTDASLGLHKRAGLGQGFGSSNYSPDIKNAITAEAERLKGAGELSKRFSGSKAADVMYDKLKNHFHKIGLKDFKSIAPLLGKGLAAGASAGLSLGAEAADTESIGDPNEDRIIQGEVKSQQDIDRIQKSDVPKEIKLKALELYKKNNIY